MKKKNSFIKPIALILAVISMMFVLSSCENKPEPPEEKAFSLVMDFTQTYVKKGTTVKYRAFLTNNEHEQYNLKHAGELVNIYVVKAEDYVDGDFSALTDAVVSETGIGPHNQIEALYKFTPTESGKYILKAYSVFTIEGKESTKDYTYECDEIEIIVY